MATYGDRVGTPCGPRRDPWGPHVDPWRHLGDPWGGPWGPMGTPWGPTEGPWGPRGTHGDHGGAKNRFHHDDNYTDPVEQHSHLTLLKPAEQTRLNVDQSKRHSNLRHLASVRDWMLEPKPLIKTAPVKRSICQRLDAARKLTGDSVSCTGGNTDRRWRFRFDSAQLGSRLLPIIALDRGLIGTNICCGVFGKRRPPLNSERLKQ